LKIIESIRTKTNKNNFVTGFPIYYGWVIMAAGTLGMIMTSPGQTYTESIFIEYLINDLTISRSLISSLYAFGTLVGGFSLPFWGKQIDRRGPRKMVTIIAILFGLACIYMGFVQNALMIAVGFILIRMLGQGSLGLVSQITINQWWVRKRGMIMGISGLLMALLGIGGFPSLVYWLISTFEWRTTYILLGVGVLAIMVPIGLLLFRNRPEDYDLQPDGIQNDRSEEPNATIEGVDEEENWTLQEAIHTSAFWVFGFSLSLFALLITGLTFHLVSIFLNQGLETSLAAGVYLPIAITAAASNLLIGYLSDHIKLGYLLAAGLLFQAVSLLMALWIRDPLSVILFGIILGITNGIPRALGTVVWPSFFGRQHLGSIFGFTSAMMVIGAALGPLPFGFAFDRIGSYHPVLWVFAVISILFGIACLLTPKPNKG
jgi:MFS transporter, OFA family, oxalate/formate antiporter